MNRREAMQNALAAGFVTTAATRAELLALAEGLLAKIRLQPEDCDSAADDHHDAPSGQWNTVVVPGEGRKIATHLGLIPDISENPTHVLSSGPFPTNLPADARVLIPAGVTVTVVDVIDTRLSGIANQGTLSFARTSNTKLRVGTILNFPGSVFDQGDEDDPIRARSEIVFDGVVDPVKDPEQITIGLISFGGRTSICGQFLDGTSTTELVSPAAAGAATITVKSATRWKVGDELQLADGRSAIDPAHFDTQMERRTIAVIKGNTITLNAPLKYAHDSDVDHLTRLVVYSNATNGTRGHTILMGETQARVCCARFNLSGRTRAPLLLNDTIRKPDKTVMMTGTNQRGRYPMHSHHLSIPFRFDRLVIDSPHSDAKWGLSHHNSHGDVTNCNVINFYGAGIVGEMGTETGAHTGNSITRNVDGVAEEDYKRFGDVDALGRPLDDRGFQGNGMWYRGPFISVENNKVNGWVREAYSWDLEPGDTPTVYKIAAIKGRDPAQVGTFDLEKTDTVPIRNCKARVVMFQGGIVFWGTGGQNTIDGCTIEKLNYFAGVPFVAFHNNFDDGKNRTVLRVKDCRIKASPKVSARYQVQQSDGLAELIIDNLSNDGFSGPLMDGDHSLPGTFSIIRDGARIK